MSTMKILGISGSPLPDSNTDRAMRAALEATGCETEFIKLSEYTIAPCKACLGCVKTNRCVIDDDGRMLAEKVREANGMIVAGFATYSSLDARTKAFIERLYPLRHLAGAMRDKPGAIIFTHAIPDGAEHLPPSADMGVNAISFYMLEEGMRIIGAVKVLGNLPCLKCGYGDACEMSGTKMMGPDVTVASVPINCVSDNASLLDAARNLGRNIAEALATPAQG